MACGARRERSTRHRDCTLRLPMMPRSSSTAILCILHFSLVLSSLNSFHHPINTSQDLIWGGLALVLGFELVSLQYLYKDLSTSRPIPKILYHYLYPMGKRPLNSWNHYLAYSWNHYLVYSLGSLSLLYLLFELLS